MRLGTSSWRRLRKFCSAQGWTTVPSSSHRANVVASVEVGINMPSNSKTAVQIAGINSYPNPLGPSMPAGSTLQADNLRTDHPGSLTPRPGQSPLERFGDPSGAAINVTSWLTGVKNWNWLYQLGDGLYPSWLDAGNLWQVLSTNVTDGTHLTISTASAAVYGVDQELFTNVVNTPTARGINWATDQYINLKNGVARL